MEAVIIAAMEICETYAEKLAIGGVLTEYEAQLYEMAARAATSYLKIQDIATRMNIFEAEKELAKAEEENRRKGEGP